MEAIVLIELIMINQSSYADGLRVHTTRPSPNSHAILAALDHAGAAAPQLGHSDGRLPVGAGDDGPAADRALGPQRQPPADAPAWNPCPHPGSVRTAAAAASVRSTPPLRRARTGTPRTPAPPALPPRRTPRPADRAASSSSEQESPQRRRPHQRPSRRP